MEDYKNGVLFAEYDSDNSNSKFSKNNYSTHQRRKRNLDCHLDDYVNMTTTGFYDMPIVRPVHITEPPLFQVPFNQFKASNNSRFAWVHSYIDDYSFRRLINNPLRYLKLLKSAGFVTPSDCSILIGMPEAKKIEHTYQNRFTERLCQDRNVNIIPNVAWADKKTYLYCFDGIPKHSAIAINSNGIIGNKDSIKIWRSGYEKALEVLEPEKILRYGDKIEGEIEEISIYFKNENLRRLRYGR